MKHEPDIPTPVQRAQEYEAGWRWTVRQLERGISFEELQDYLPTNAKDDYQRGQLNALFQLRSEQDEGV